MTKRDEKLAVIRERQNEEVRHVLLSQRFWSPLWFFHLREARRLHALTERDLDRLPPQRYHNPRPSAINVAHTEQLMYARRNPG